MAIPVFDPMLATTDGPRPRNAVIEPKWDGVRSLVTLRADGRASIRSRNGRDVTSAYPELHRRPSSMTGREGVFDGEVIAVDDAGRASFQRLQRRMNVLRPSAATIAATPVYYVVFDVLWLDGQDVTSRRLHERRALLEGVLAGEAGSWQLTNRFPGPLTDELLEMVDHAGLEGLVLKSDGPYRPGERTKDWVKVKFRRTIRVVIGGRATDSNSLSIGVYHDGALRYVGQVGMAMPQTDARQLDAFLQRIRRPDSPFVDLAAGAPVTFVEPHVVLDVTYLEITDAGTLRQPIFGAVRPDLRAEIATADGHLRDALDLRRGAVKMRANQRL